MTEDDIYLAMREMADSFVKEKPEGKSTYDRLRARGWNRREACDEIARAMSVTLWAVGKGLAESGSADEGILYPALRRIAEGESVAEIFPDSWRGEAL